MSGLGPINPPSGFADVWTPFVNVTRVGSGQSSTFTTDYDFEARKTAWLGANLGYTSIYVDLTTGNNNNAGTIGAPIRSIDLAYGMALRVGVTSAIIYIKGGTLAAPLRYLASNTQARSGQADLNATWSDAWFQGATAKPIMMLPWNAGERYDNVYNTTGSVTFTATADSTIFTGTNSTSLIDYNNRSRLGAPRPLVALYMTATDAADAITKINSAHAALSALDDGLGDTHAEGVYWRDVANSITYVKLFDGRNPTTAFTNRSLIRPNTTGANNKITPSGAQHFIFDGCNFAGGAQGPLGVTAPSGFRPRLDVARCTFVGPGKGAAGNLWTEGVDNTDGVDAVFYRCEWSGGDLDGANHKKKNFTVEIECEGYWNGRDQAGSENFSNNATSQHELGRCLTVNCRYLYSQDRSVHDVGASKRWMLGTVCGSRRGNVTGFGGAANDSSAGIVSGHQNNGATTVIWMDNCSVRNGPFDAMRYTFVCYGGCTLYYANMNAPTGNPGSGTVSSYTP